VLIDYKQPLLATPAQNNACCKNLDLRNYIPPGGRYLPDGEIRGDVVLRTPSETDSSNTRSWYPDRAQAILPARDYPPCPAKKFPRKPYDKSFIDQAFSVKMAGYWTRSFFCEFMDLESVSVHKMLGQSEV